MHMEIFSCNSSVVCENGNPSFFFPRAFERRGFALSLSHFNLLFLERHSKCFDVNVPAAFSTRLITNVNLFRCCCRFHANSKVRVLTADGCLFAGAVGYMPLFERFKFSLTFYVNPSLGQKLTLC